MGCMNAVWMFKIFLCKIYHYVYAVYGEFVQYDDPPTWGPSSQPWHQTFSSVNEIGHPIKIVI